MYKIYFTKVPLQPELLHRQENRENIEHALVAELLFPAAGIYSVYQDERLIKSMTVRLKK
jgi:hypothetical protein